MEADNNCALGKWLHGAGQGFSKAPGFAKLVANHARFHKAVGAIIRKADSGRLKTDEVALGTDSEYAAASNAVVTSLMAIKRIAA